MARVDHLDVAQRILASDEDVLTTDDRLGAIGFALVDIGRSLRALAEAKGVR